MSEQPNITATPATSPSTTSVAEELKNLNNQIRAKIISDALKKGGIGALTGAAFSFLIFKRKLAPIWLGLGLGLGMAYSDGSQLIRTAHDSVLKSAFDRYESESNNSKEPIGDNNNESLNSTKNKK